MAIERARADANNGAISPEEIEARREAVRARAQTQN
jgi:hypothetical protein